MIEALSSSKMAIVPTSVDGNQETALLACLWSAQQSLVKAKSIGEAEKIRCELKALEALSKEFKLSKKIQGDATELRINAEKQLGKMLKKMDKNKGARGNPNGQGVRYTDVTAQKLSDLGISKYESAKFQQLASVDESTFDSILADLKEQAKAGRQSALSTAGVLRVIRDEQRGDREPLFSPLIKPSDNWNFGSIRYGRIDGSMDEDWGYIPGEIYANCFWYYVKPGDLVVAPMAGAIVVIAWLT